MATFPRNTIGFWWPAAVVGGQVIAHLWSVRVVATGQWQRQMRGPFIYLSGRATDYNASVGSVWALWATFQWPWKATRCLV
ncbi:hypothetical protein C8R47DRAFT_1154442 [Mycena vitilis]|nr:hypothetical protein C8R47DRAFT_1154442 [Mycena vitilis]